MAKEHTEHETPSESRAEAALVGAGVVQGIAQVIAEQIAQQQEAAVAGAYSGSFDVRIVFNGFTYEVLLTAPEPTEEDPGEWIAEGTRYKVVDGEKIDVTEFLKFRFRATDDWTVGGGLPIPVTVGSVTIEKLFGSFSRHPPVPDTRNAIGEGA